MFNACQVFNNRCFVCGVVLHGGAVCGIFCGMASERGQVKRSLLIETASGNKLTPKQKRFVDAYIMNDGSSRKAAIAAGYSAKNDKVARSMGTENLLKPAIREELRAVLASHQISEGTLSKKLHDAIDSGIGKKATNSDALRGIEMGFRLLDSFPAERKQIEQRTLTVSLQGKTLDDITTHVETLLNDVKQMKDNILLEGELSSK